MEFTLFYEGILKSGNKASAKDKHRLRQYFHKQLKVLWSEPPLKGLEKYQLLETTPPGYENEFCFEQKFGNFQFVPLIRENLDLIAEIDIILLTSEPLGGIVNNSGDIDNRLKTLFDGLRCPSKLDEIKELEPEPDEKPFYCLLQDDKLITKVSVTTKRLVDSDIEKDKVRLILSIIVKTTNNYKIFKHY
ncbi:hypothetical protein A0J48_023345 [Sphaerospermopsis aphanizomenoides BCCUSP55]|uniref:hypothetical protein n=1 Tax=Sphaerospermopsis aphanizomenoides TaxID=459663 RepID=UPI0019051314|nr:hypothetical protein [Sphaerospermopsis aphanizomenoides]MBK1990423.1 hypothetical protein [Sphaerospermopsis aphanizomenoides BCCUSP55]